jgi:bifunctional non-homologous end joining protein LigD
VTLYSRNGKIVSDNYRPIAKALEKVKRDAVLDGELVALDAQGISRFQLLQNALRREATLVYCLFDIMFLDGGDLRNLPLLERKDRLRRLLPEDPHLRFSEHRPEYGNWYFKEAENESLEGIVAPLSLGRAQTAGRFSSWPAMANPSRSPLGFWPANRPPLTTAANGLEGVAGGHARAESPTAPPQSFQ